MLKRMKLEAALRDKEAAKAEFSARSVTLAKRRELLLKELDAADTNEKLDDIDTRRADNDKELAEVQNNLREAAEKIEELRAELAELDDEPTQEEIPDTQRTAAPVVSTRGFFRNVSPQERSRVLGDAGVKEFLERTREFIGQKRAISGAELNIPEIMLGLLRDNLHRYSKLITHVGLRPVSGIARQNIVGAIPEGVWTEMCATLNELDFKFNQIEVDGYKVGGFIPVCNAMMEDSDVNLASEILDMIGQAIGIALDKAILYGTGLKMPLGIVTRLAQATKPAEWSTKAPEWKDLHTSNIIKIDPAGKSAEEFFAEFMLKLSAAKTNYSTGVKFWAMNENTYNLLVSKTITFNAAGALVATTNNTLPIVGGTVVLLPFMADGDIVGGYGSLYLLVERAGAQFAMSEHARFIEDQTLFKGTARYDGVPVFGEAFIAVNINNAAPKTTTTFAPDEANLPNP